MTDTGFTAAQAAQVLSQAGLLDGVFLGESGQLLKDKSGVGPAAGIEGSFQGAVLDNRQLKEAELFVALAGANIDARKFAPKAIEAGHWVLTRPLTRQDDLLMTRGPAGALLAADPEAALACLAAHWRSRFAIPLVGVTGTNGKTTTKDFLAAALSGGGPVCATAENFNNKLGLPLTLLGLHRDHRYAVIEMGASAVGHIAHLAGLAQPTVAIITNAGEAHLAEFGSLEGIIQGKGEILDRLPVDGRAILNSDSPGFEQWRDRAPCPVVSFGLATGDNIWSWQPATRQGGPEIKLKGGSWPVPLSGLHNGANLVAAILAARAVGLSDAAIQSGLNSFQASSHRGLVLTLAGRQILDDAYNANPTSMAAAAKAVGQLPGPGRALAVLGHMAELGPDSQQFHLETGRRIKAAGVDLLLAVGPLAKPLAQGFYQNSKQEYCFAEQSEAVSWLVANTQPGDRILIKGSRSAAMENIITLLQDHWPKGEAE